MSNSTTLLDTIAANQAAKEVIMNALADAFSPASLWGRHASACNGLTWGYYGGNYQIGLTSNAIANGTVTLTASTTNYLYADPTTGALSINTTGVPSGKIPLYSIVTGTTTVTSYTDLRSYQPSDPRMLPTIRVSYPLIAASAGPCGTWPDDLASSIKNKGYLANKPYYNLGCAQQRNLAAMVANPSDLVQPRAETPVYAGRRTVVLDKYRKGESTATTYPEDKTKISNVGQ